MAQYISKSCEHLLEVKVSINNATCEKGGGGLIFLKILHISNKKYKCSFVLFCFLKVSCYVEAGFQNN